MFHNHVEKHYSYNCFPEDKLAKDSVAKELHKGQFSLARTLYPFVAWPLYIAGAADGSHLFPLPMGRLYQNAPRIEKIKCLISTGVMGAVLASLYFAFQKSIKAMAFYYFIPHVVFGWWLFVVTYLQHHSKDTLVYDDHDWKFVEGGFETVDRQFGLGIDQLSHHITSDHVIHHMFFTQIPHYNLPKATKALKEYLAANNLLNLYKSEKTFDFPLRVHKYMWQFGLKAARASPVPSNDIPLAVTA
jgi:omega-3 fatty acid desaturase (delta-15 desaturase)